MATIIEVAEKAGVSIATVSYVVNQSRPVSEALTQRVYSAMLELDYLPNQMARSLRGGKTGLIGVIAPSSPGALYFAEVSAVLEKTATAYGYSIIYCNSERDIECEKYHIDNLISKQVDGIIFINTGQSDQELVRLLRQNIPVVLVDWAPLDVYADQVSTDFFLAGQIAGEYYCGLGHWELGCVCPHHNPAMLRIVDGFEKSLLHYGRMMKQDYKVISGYSIQDGKEAFKQLVHRVPSPTGIFFATDTLAVGGMIAAQELGMSIPQDISILGFDNLPITGDVYPPLSTVDRHIEKVFTEPFVLLENRIKARQKQEADTDSQNIIVAPELIVRASCREIK